MPLRPTPLVLGADLAFVPQFLDEHLDLSPRESGQYLLELLHGCAPVSALLDVLQKQRLVRFPIQAFSPGIGATFAQEAV